jgi:hypothetical protein
MSLTNEDRDAATRLAIQQARDDLLAFVMLMNPSFSVGPHHRVLCDTFQHGRWGVIHIGKR